MKTKSKIYYRAASLLLGMFVFVLSGQFAVMAQDSEGEVQHITPEADSQKSDTVTINVKDANIAEVLKAYSVQTGRSIVVGPDVVSDNVNVRLVDQPWDVALDVILKPYGFGYRITGDIIVINPLEKIIEVEGIEPLASKVFKLKYLDAYDIRDVCEAQLTSRGKFTILSNKGLPGWEFGGGSSSGGSTSRSGSSIGSSERKTAESIEKSKTIIVTDVPSSLTAIQTILEELDQEPSQVLIEARFIEIRDGGLQDIGLDFATGVGGLATPGVEVSNPGGNNQWGVEQNDSAGLKPAAFDPASESLSGLLPYNSGLQLLFSRVAGENFEIMLHALEETGKANILSAPQILTLDNQEAAILVGEKFPIIESDVQSGGGVTPVTSTSLDYYENIGIQLNVIPQVSNEEYINMIIHPVVSEIDRLVKGGAGSDAITEYPVLNVREAQTQILLKSGGSAMIGGLQQERDLESIYKVPFLGDIPYLGRLFRRETMKSEKIELLIFIKATIIEEKEYAAESAKLKDELETRGGFKAEEEVVEDAVEPTEEEMVELMAVIEDEEAVEATEMAEATEVEAVEVEATEIEAVEVPVEAPEEPVDSEKDDIVAFVNGEPVEAEEAVEVGTEEM